MRKRPLVFIMAVSAVSLFLAGTALATPKITGHGKTHSINWNISSLRTTRVFVKTDTAGALAVIDILTSNGKRVVRRLYSGRAAKPGVALWSPAWNGTNAAGKYLSTGSYKYRVRINSAGKIATAIGSIPVYTGVAAQQSLGAAGVRVWMYRPVSVSASTFTTRIRILTRDGRTHYWVTRGTKTMWEGRFGSTTTFHFGTTMELTRFR